MLANSGSPAVTPSSVVWSHRLRSSKIENLILRQDELATENALLGRHRQRETDQGHAFPPPRPFLKCFPQISKIISAPMFSESLPS